MGQEPHPCPIYMLLQGRRKQRPVTLPSAVTLSPRTSPTQAIESGCGRAGARCIGEEGGRAGSCRARSTQGRPMGQA
eukprot:352672-Chlamydomonas_euryale.AAC.14